MVKYFCDVCETEMRKNEHGRLIIEFETLKLEVLVYFKNVANAGNICHRCIKNAVIKGTKLKDRNDVL